MKHFAPKPLGIRPDAVPGDVWHWYSEKAKKNKYHLCLTYDYEFVFVSTPADFFREFDFDIRSESIRFIRPTPQKFSSISCTTIIEIESAGKLAGMRAERVGNLDTAVMIDLLRHMGRLRTLSNGLVRRLGECHDGMTGNVTNHASGDRRPRQIRRVGWHRAA